MSGEIKAPILAPMGGVRFDTLRFETGAIIDRQNWVGPMRFVKITGTSCSPASVAHIVPRRIFHRIEASVLSAC
jgi:hypothetical protein